MRQVLTALVSQFVADFHWGHDRLAMPLSLAVTTEVAVERVFGALSPLSGAVWDSLVMALCRACTGLANEMEVITSTRGEWLDIQGMALPLLSVEALRERLVREIHRANADTQMAIPSLSLRQAAETAHCRGPPADPRGRGPA